MAALFPMVLIVLDGWGHAPDGPGNAIRRSHPKFIDALGRRYPSGLLAASGEAVGLPPGYIGNSEVGHLCLGAGRVVLQDLPRINRSIRTGEFGRIEVLAGALDQAARPGAALHLMGLISDGGVHSHIDHLEALLRLAASRGLKDVFVHAFLDGRDTPPRSGLSYVGRAGEVMRRAGAGVIATVSGRYYAMDRDNHWERTALAYGALVARRGVRQPSAAAAVEASYAADVTDEFVVPAVIDAPPGGRDPAVRDGDVIVFFNFRADRARQLTRAFTDPAFDRFERPAPPRLAAFVCFTAYDRGASDRLVAFPPQPLRGTLGEAVSGAGLHQLRIAETEKYAHVTYFFNGGEETAFAKEERCLIPSLRVATYDRQPEMSAPAVTREVMARLAARPRQVVILNYANADMVGHTGRLEETIAACRVIDTSVEAVVSEVLRLGGAAVVTADHGNAEQMIDPADGGPVTAHTTNPVPVCVAAAGLEARRLRDGGLLADVAPTMLELLELRPPDEMEGRSLLQG